MNTNDINEQLEQLTDEAWKSKEWGELWGIQWDLSITPKANLFYKVNTLFDRAFSNSPLSWENGKQHNTGDLIKKLCQSILN